MNTGAFSISTKKCIDSLKKLGFVNRINMEHKKVTVVIVTKNRKEELATAIKSCLAQIYPMEILVLDDGSTDGSFDLVKREFIGVRVIRFNVSEGYIKRRNQAARLAKGDILFSLDDDAIFSSKHIVKDIIAEFKHPRIGAVSIPVIDINKNNKLRQPSLPGKKDCIIDSYIGTGYAIRKDLFIRLGGYRESIVHQGEEKDLCIRIYDEGYVVKLGCSDPIHHLESITRDSKKIYILGRRNDILFTWWNIPMPYFIIYFIGTIFKNLIFIFQSGKLIWGIEGLFHGCKAICDRFGEREPVSVKTYCLFKKMKKKGVLSLEEVVDDMYKKENLIISHAGKQHSYKVALSFKKLGRLSKFITSAYYKPGIFPDKIFSKNKIFHKKLMKRNEPDLHNKVKRFPFLEIPELVLRSLIGNKRLTSKLVYFRDVLFDKFVARTQLKTGKIFWGFQGSCLESLKKAKKKGMIAVCEFSTAHITAALDILGKERDKYPEWADTISNASFPYWYIDRLKQEPLEANYCIAASSFTKKTLVEAGIPSSKIFILPLGVDLEQFKFKERSKEMQFNILFVGGVGQRKGIKYLLDAYEKIKTNNTSLKIVGPIVGSSNQLFKKKYLFDYLGILKPVEVCSIMHQCHVLVLPSLFEGFGLVVLEAMATGIPVIASENSIGPDIIEEGKEGFILKPEDVEGLRKKLEFLKNNRKKLIKMGEAAAKKAKKYSWIEYRKRLKRILELIEKI
ncbi:MAG: glycosyltransferase [Candidatus Omnitrophota bacterium]